MEVVALVERGTVCVSWRNWRRDGDGFIDEIASGKQSSDMRNCNGYELTVRLETHSP
jgi:hypothetical protein